MIGTSVERYKILEELGQGGMSVVYRGLDTSLEREVAVKMLHGHLASKPENRLRFHREAKAIARLRHANILEVYDYSSEDADKSYIVMEYIPGSNLRQFLLQHGPPPPEAAAAIAIAICQALEHAHEQGVIHRDLKPENVMISAQGVIKLMDFGIAHVIGAETMTQTGSLMGSPAHMAPELIEGLKVDVRSDIFSLGTVLYWITTGKLPFDGQNAPQVLKRVLDGNYIDPEAVDARIGQEFAAIIKCCLANNPDERYPDVTAVLEALIQALARNGFNEPDQLLNDYFKNPLEFTRGFSDMIVARLTKRGQQAFQSRQIAQATRCFNRILAYDPDNPAVRAFLESIAHRRTYHRIGIGAAVLVLLCASAMFLYQRADSGPSDKMVAQAILDTNEAAIAATREAVISAAALSVQRAAADASHSAQRRRASALGEHVVASAKDLSSSMPERALLRAHVVRPFIPLQPSVIESISKKVVSESTASTALAEPKVRYRFKVSPPAATLYLEGRAVSAMEAAQGVDLTLGRHVVTARSPGCKPFRQILHVTRDPQERTSIVLDWDDGFVHVVSNHDALVWLNEEPQPRSIRAGGKGAALRIRFGPADTVQSEQKVSLRIAASHDLQQSRKQVVTVRPGAHATVNVNFASGN